MFRVLRDCELSTRFSGITMRSGRFQKGFCENIRRRRRFHSCADDGSASINTDRRLGRLPPREGGLFWRKENSTRCTSTSTRKPNRDAVGSGQFLVSKIVTRGSVRVCDRQPRSVTRSPRPSRQRNRIPRHCCRKSLLLLTNDLPLDTMKGSGRTLYLCSADASVAMRPQFVNF